MPSFWRFPRIREYCALALLSAAELRLFMRLLFEDTRQYGFVVDNLRGILAGKPAFPAFQHRLLGAGAWWLLERITGDSVLALELLTGLLLTAANFVAFEMARRRGACAKIAFKFAALLGLARLLVVYRLEYPWDGVDVLLFLSFGYLARANRTSWCLAALGAVGVLNHETVLYVPLWYALCALDRNRVASERKLALRLALTGLPMLVCIWALRAALYKGRPSWANGSAEDVGSAIANPFHLGHNLRQLFVRNWESEKAVISLAFLATVAVLGVRLRDPRARTAVLWTLCVLACIVCFGYVNETRLYLAPIAFWFGYASRSVEMTGLRA